MLNSAINKSKQFDALKLQQIDSLKKPPKTYRQTMRPVGLRPS